MVLMFQTSTELVRRSSTMSAVPSKNLGEVESPDLCSRPAVDGSDDTSPAQASECCAASSRVALEVEPLKLRKLFESTPSKHALLLRRAQSSLETNNLEIVPQSSPFVS